MGVLATDSGAGADASPIAAPWAATSGFGGIRRLGGQFAARTAGTDNLSVYKGPAYPADGYAEVRVPVLGTGGDNDAGPAYRVQANGDCYFLTNYDTTPNVAIVRVISGAPAVLAALPGSYSLNGRARIKVTGTGAAVTIEAIVGGVSLGSYVDSSPQRIVAAGDAGVYMYDGVTRFDQFEAGDYVVGVSGNANAGDAGAGGGLSGGSTLAGTAAAGDGSAGGGIGGGSTLSGNANADNGAAGGNLGAAGATVTSEPLKTNNGTLLPNTALSFVAVYHLTTGVLIVRRTGLSTDASGIFSFYDGSLVVGQSYRFDWETASGERRMPVKAAA